MEVGKDDDEVASSFLLAMTKCLRAFKHSTLLNAFLIVVTLENPMHIYSRGMYKVRIKLTGLNQFFYFGDSYFSGHGHDRVKIARSATVDQIAQRISFPGFNNGEIGFKS